MTLKSEGNVFIKFDLPPEDKARFAAACAKLGISMSEMLRTLIVAFAESAEENDNRLLEERLKGRP